MLKTIARIAVLLLVVSSASATLPDAITGLWRNDHEERFAEMQLRRDGRFASLSRNNAIIAVIPLREQSGTWRLRGTTLTLDGTNRHTHERSQKRLTLVDVTGRTLLLRTIDGHVDTYRRLDYPCVDTESGQHRAVSTDAVVGRWRGHYRTHEIEVTVNRGGRAKVRGWDSDHTASTKYTGTWHLAKNTLTITPADKDGMIKWLLDSASGDCISFGDDSGMVYTLQRIR